MTLQDVLQQVGRRSLDGATVLVDAAVGDASQAAELVSALRRSVGNDGTILMPAFTGDRTLSDHAAPAIAFHTELAVDPALGAVPETFRRTAGTLRSSHPTSSFSASGPRAQILLSTNRDNNPLGPVKKLNLLNGWSLRIDQPARLYTPYHLAELHGLRGLTYRGTAKRINIGGYEERVVIEHLAVCTAGFTAIDEALAGTGSTAASGVHLAPLRELVRAAADAISSAPEKLLCSRADCVSCAARRRVVDAAADRT